MTTKIVHSIEEAKELVHQNIVEENRKLSKEVSILKTQLENTRLKVYWYKEIIEKARQAWRIGDNAESAFKELVRLEKQGKL